LVLSKNAIEDLTPLQELIRLTDLDIANNPIEDLDTLTGLAKRRFDQRIGGLNESGKTFGHPIMVRHNVRDTEEPTWYRVLFPGPGGTLDVKAR
jgi:Leucine-rich repeat (LRR) protein